MGFSAAIGAERPEAQSPLTAK